MDNNNGQMISLSFAAIDPFVETNITDNFEKEIKGKEFISWGSNNDYPNYLFSLYNDVTTLRTICNGLADYVVGENVTCTFMSSNDAEDLVHKLALDLAIYGGYALEVHRGLDGKVKGSKYLDIRNVRSNKKNTSYFYSEDWGHTFGRVKYLEYPAFDRNNAYRTDEDGNRKVIGTSIYVYKMSHNMVYPSPMYAGNGCWAAEIEKSIVQYQLNAINNGFAGNYIINFNGGSNPDDKLKQETERNIREKFCGYRNAGRPILSWNKSKDNAATIEALPVDDFADRFNSLQTVSKHELFSAFRAHPVIFGLPSQNLGFSEEPFETAWGLFNKTVVRPIQRKITNSFDYIYGQSDAMTIEPFAVDWEDESENNTEVQ